MKDELINYINEKKSLRNGFPSHPYLIIEGDMIVYNKEKEDDLGKRVTGKSSMGSSISAKKRQKGSMDKFIMHPPEKQSKSQNEAN